jgi:hypothetical protein|tara:strand:+ start:488 stop:700 length:213 start_codon:yes stop_codon:yes gene_type:complete
MGEWDKFNQLLKGEIDRLHPGRKEGLEAERRKISEIAERLLNAIESERGILETRKRLLEKDMQILMSELK